MKKFFKNPYYLAWSIILGVIILITIIGAFVPALYKILMFIIGAESIYSAVLIIVSRKKNKINLEEFNNNPETEQKKFSFTKAENKINNFLFVGMLFLVGAMLIYFTFKI